MASRYSMRARRVTFFLYPVHQPGQKGIVHLNSLSNKASFSVDVYFFPSTHTHYYTCSKIWEILGSSFRSENGGRRTGRWRGWRFALVEEKRTAEFASDCGSRSKKIFGPINQTSDAVGSGHDLEDKALNYYQCMRILGIPHPPILLQVRDSSDEPVASSFLQADGTSRLVVQPLHLPCF